MIQFLKKSTAQRYLGPVLTVPRATPSDMGAYFCVASNDVPPMVNNRIDLYVQCECTVQF